MPITGYSMAPMKDGSPHAQAVASGNASIKAATMRNSAGGRKRRRKYKGGKVVTINALNNVSNYPTNYSPENTQYKLASTQISSDVASQGDRLNGGARKSKRRKNKKRNFFSKLFRFTMKKRK
jgi:hypothetical protein